MSDNIVRFSRLLRIFEFYKNPAYIVELEENNKKELYISYIYRDSHLFLSKEEAPFYLKKDFEKLSNHCLMSQCTNASRLFEKSHITHFEADCSSLVNGAYMFSFSKISTIKSNFPSLKHASWMFEGADIENINIDFPSLKSGQGMFRDSKIKYFTGDIINVENSFQMFAYTDLKEFNSKIKNISPSDQIFYKTPEEFKQNNPYLFI